jgi:hypothetical protein
MRLILIVSCALAAFSAATFWTWLFIIPVTLFSVGLLVLIGFETTQPATKKLEALTKRLEDLESTVGRIGASRLVNR